MFPFLEKLNICMYILGLFMQYMQYMLQHSVKN